ncbi:MAG: hypothetical protein B7Z01_07280 [Brevundimonas subvibrioides]|uniref:Uncharacterized protein n=1 Tax=Brevundimonas subvibrioides TaxID=74313 RepID=A0A258FNA0_9CAUL|nr:MAG: hypothetical protein B7Z01_07280 [Brevundimonas subvibrioides]
MFKVSLAALAAVMLSAAAPNPYGTDLKQSVAIYPTKEACYLDYGCLRVGEAWFCPTQESEICETYPD